MSRRWVSILFSVIMVMALLLGGCTGQSAPATSVSTTSTGAMSSTNAGGPIKIVDSTGKTVELAQLPQRIVVVGQGPYMALHTIFMFPEAAKRMVGMERKSETVSDFLPLVDPTFNDKAVLDPNPGPEQIATLNPDLVICKGTTANQLAPGLEKLGIPVFHVGLENPEQYYQDLTNLGVIFGNEARAKELVAFFQSRVDRITQRVATLDPQQRPSVLTVQYTDRGGQIAVNVPAKSYMQTIQAQTAGGNLVWLPAAVGDGWTVVNLEQIVSWNPDKIFVVVWYTLDPTEVIAKLKTDPGWSGLKAVQNDQVFAYPTDIMGWDSPEPRWILGMTWVAKKTNPDQFTDVDMNQEVYQFFSQLYGMDQAAVDQGIMPKVQLDVH